MNKSRDIQLDIYRALVMIYILCVIHVTYWLGAFQEPIKSLILFEMPVIFFISGASLQVTLNRRSFISMVGNRASRVLIPFYAYCIILLTGILLLETIAWVLPSFNASSHYNLSLMKVVVPSDGLFGLPFMYHLWFIVPFLGVCCSFPLQRLCYEKIGKARYFMIGFVLFALSCLTDIGLLREVLGYNLFFIGGVFYYRKMNIKGLTFVLILSLLALILFQLAGVSFTPMQNHKFPPDIYFICFGFAALSLFGLLFTFVKLPENKLIRRWNRHGYSIYLWQSITFFIVYTLSSVLFSRFVSPQNSGVRFLILSVLVFVFATSLSYMVVPLERVITSMLIKAGKAIRGLIPASRSQQNES